MPEVTLQMNKASRPRELLQIRAGREQDIPRGGGESSMLPNLERAARPW